MQNESSSRASGYAKQDLDSEEDGLNLGSQEHPGSSLVRLTTEYTGLRTTTVQTHLTRADSP